MNRTKRNALALTVILLLVATFFYLCGMTHLYATVGLLSVIPFAVAAWPVRCQHCGKSVEWQYRNSPKYCPHCGEKFEDE
jgi:hypothetical protein